MLEFLCSTVLVMWFSGLAVYVKKTGLSNSQKALIEKSIDNKLEVFKGEFDYHLNRQQQVITVLRDDLETLTKNQVTIVENQKRLEVATKMANPVSIFNRK